MKKLVLSLLALASLLGAAAGCDAVQFSALNVPTETPTRTPRPTFTPRPSATAKPSPTETPSATDTPAATDTAAPVVVAPTDTPTRKPVATRPPATAVPPTQPPAPQFSVNSSDNKWCEAGTYVIYVQLRKTSTGGRFLGGYNMGLFDGAGNILKDPDGRPAVFQTWPDGQQQFRFYGGCPRHASNDSPLPFNGKMDVNDYVRMGTKSIVLRFVKSSSDLTALSSGVTLDYSKPGEYWLYYVVP